MQIYLKADTEDAPDKSIEAEMGKAISYFEHKVLQHLPDDIADSTWTAGGVVRDFFTHGFVTNDFDLFFSDEDQAADAESWLKHNDDWTEIHSGPNGTMFAGHGTKIHVITEHLFADPADCAMAFDFTVCCGAISRGGVFLHDRFFIDLARKTLVINQLPRPASTLQRLQKYIGKGYRICNGGMLELIQALQGLELDNPDENELSFYPDGTPRFMGID